jgi:hypothetical protein
LGQKNSFWDDWVTPQLANNPGLANDAYRTGNPSTVAPMLSYASKGVSVQDAINDHGEEQGTSSFWKKLANPALTGLDWLGKGLKEIQSAYKFTHSVYVDHGFLPGFAVTLGVIGGGIGGGFLGGPAGAVVGADVAGAGLRKLSTIGPWASTYSDSYAKSQDENYKVSPGRDFSNALAQGTKAIGWDSAYKAFHNTNKGLGMGVSGIGDLAYDINTDPVMIIGRFGQLMKFGKLSKLDKAGEVQLKYPIMDTVPGVRQFVFERSRVPLTSEQMDALKNGNGIFNSSARIYNRALDDIAQSTAGDIALKYPQLGAAAAGRLGPMTDPEQVHQFLKTSLYFGELEGTLAGQAMVPTRTLLRASLAKTKVADALQNAAVPRYIVSAAGERVKNPDYNPASVKQKASRIYQTFTGYMPYSVDQETGKLSLSKFRWNANDSATVVYRIARFGMGNSAAKELAGKYAEAVAIGNKGLARSIKNHALFETFKAAGLPDDNVLVKKVWDEINKIDDQLVGSQVYGTDILGNPLGQYATTQGPKVGAIWGHQASDMFDIPDFNAVKNAMRDAGKYTKHVGKLDEFVSNRYTNKIFKPLALATAGFGLRIAASESIPMFARYGVINTFKAKLGVAAAKSHYELIDQEKPHVLSAALSALGIKYGIDPNTIRNSFPAFIEAKNRGLQFAAKMTAADQMELAQRVILTNNGHFLAEAVQTGHGYDAATSYGMKNAAHYYFQIQKNSPIFRDLGEFTTYEASSTYYTPTLVTNLNKAAKEVGARNIASDLIRDFRPYINLNKFQIDDNVDKLASYEKFMSMREDLINKEYTRMLDSFTGKYKGYDKEKKTVSRWSNATNDGDLKIFAQDRVDSVLGMVIGKDGTFHEGLAKNVASGLESDYNAVNELTQSFPRSVPAAVAGPILEQYIPRKDLINTITSYGFKKVIDPIVNGLAREPLYLMHVADAYERLAPRVAAGTMLEDQALRIAQTQATYSMLPQIHNTALRNQFSQLARNFLPFYFAQEQALKRAYATLKDTSVASPVFSRGLRFFQIAEHGINDPAFVQQDENGNRYINLPFVGGWGEAVQAGLAAYGVPMVSALPISAKGSLISLKTVLQELQMPGASPIFAISANFISDLFPATGPLVKGTIGDISYQRGVIDTLVPAAWAKTALAALTPIDLTGQMANATATALAAAYYHNQVPGPDSGPMERQAFVDRIKNNARSVLILKTFLNLTSPLAPQVSQEDAGFRDEFWKLVKSKGNYADAMLQFLGNHGDRAISYTVAKTVSNVPGAKYPYIQSTVDFIDGNPQLFGQNSRVATGAMFLIPQDNVNNQSDLTIYNELLQQHLRTRRTPEEMLKAFYVAQGDQMMSGEIKQHVAAINQADANYDTYSKNLETQRWSGVMKKMQNLYPVWYADYTDNEGRVMAKTAYNQLLKIFASPDAPNTDQAKQVKALLSDYNKHQSVMSQYNMLNIQGIASTAETQNWENYLLRLKESDPRLSSVISTVFMKLG